MWRLFGDLVWPKKRKGDPASQIKLSSINTRSNWYTM